MQLATGVTNLVQGVDKDRIGEEAAVVNATADSGQLLVYDPTRTDIEVPDFRVAHLPIRQADVEARGAQPC